MKNKSLRLLALLVALCMAIGLAGCGGAKTAGVQTGCARKKGKTKSGLCLCRTGGRRPGGASLNDLGRKYLEKEIPDVETTFVESVPEGADAERVLTELAQKGNKIIFATSFGYMDYIIKVAEKFPNVTFLHCSGYKTAKNVGTYFGKIEQPRYLSRPGCR